MRTITQYVAFIGLLLLLTSCAFHRNGSESLGTDDEKSTNLERDIKTMWSVQKKQAGDDWVASTDNAIRAANRVFNTVDLTGLKAQEVEEKLRFDLRSEDYGYYAPFWPIPKRVYPIRIDNGRYGWQFDLYFDAQERVIKIEKRWIH